MTASIAPVTVACTVPLAPAAAFALFAESFGRWWPRAYTWSGDLLASIAIASHEGGLCSEWGPDGFRCDWGRVLTCSPPHALALAWQIGAQREPVPDAARASTVDVRFEAHEEGTRVMLEHRDFARHGDGAADYRAAMASPQGWPYILEQFAAAAS